MNKRNELGITLVALVITIIILLILAGITIGFTIGDNGIIEMAKRAKDEQLLAQIKENISMEILDAEGQAIVKGKKLEQDKLDEIISKYGELQEDGDTIKLKDIDKQISLKEIYTGETKKTEVTPLKLSLGPYTIGTDRAVSLTDFNPIVLDNLKMYKECKITFANNGAMGTYVSARIYVDNELVETISDSNEHIISLNNKDYLKINLYSYNSLENGHINFSLELR